MNPDSTGEVALAAYPLLETPEAMQKIMRLIDENLQGQRFDVLQLPRIKIMRDGGMFQIETAAGTETAQTLTGVITAFRQARIYWGRPYTGSKERPSCTSMDGFTGQGKPGGNCTECPYAQFGTARNLDGSQGAGQACKELRQMLVLLPGQMLPHRLDVPPTSIQQFQKYSLNLTYAGAAYWGVTTKLALEMAPTTSGIPVPRVSFKLYSRLNNDQTKLLEPYHDRMRGFLKPMSVDADEESFQILDLPPGGPSKPEASDDIPF